MSEIKNIAIVGGTGALGGGLAMACARAGLAVFIGSRDVARAEAAAAEIAENTGAKVVGLDNVACAEAGEIVAITVPSANHVSTLETIADKVAGKIVLDTTVPLVPPKVARVQMPAEGCAANRAAATLGPQARLVTGFHSVSAQKLRKGEKIDGDVLLFSDDVAARETIVALADRIGLRGVHAGPLANSVAAEALTSVLIGINKRYNIPEGAGIVVTGIRDKAAERA
ncbi:NADPH-dependent F420 reductase [Nitratireductor sp. StC3]|uniref:NADPH-dependent F420 reductase n=1 Tax=Nitratireductor sp. StC3 TaxID=2126741 RepID=UPI000D0CBDCC|nr:NADPH-dependent F420 reductase [Nitratireductor sp. StC3]PSM17465.1 NADPH-dependent F420 reductase [Nitratireductor sp. StC3]